MFYDKYLQLCHERNVRPTTAAAEMGLKSANVYRWKTGSNPTDATKLIVCEYFGVRKDFFNEEYDKKSAQSDEELDAELMGLMREANEQEETREMLQNLMQRSDLRALLHATKNATPEQIDAVTEMLLRFKGRNQYD